MIERTAHGSQPCQFGARTTDWRGLCRRYAVAAALNLAAAGALLAVRPVWRPPIVWDEARAADGFDPLEVVGSGLIVTLPIEVGGAGVPSRAAPGLN